MRSINAEIALAGMLLSLSVVAVAGYRAKSVHHTSILEGTSRYAARIADLTAHTIYTASRVSLLLGYVHPLYV
jgi:hypothetical protein